jgi:hypothetical protein
MTSIQQRAELQRQIWPLPTMAVQWMADFKQ